MIDNDSIFLYDRTEEFQLILLTIKRMEFAREFYVTFIHLPCFFSNYTQHLDSNRTITSRSLLCLKEKYMCVEHKSMSKEREKKTINILILFI